MTTSPGLEEALNILRAAGRKIGSAGVSSEGQLLMTVDGRMMNAEQVRELAGELSEPSAASGSSDPAPR